MERKGAVNCYSGLHGSVYTLNMASGTTPFIIHVKGFEYRSCMYRLGTSSTPLIISEVFYRPTVEEFRTLDKETKEYVLRGCLLHAPFGHPTLEDDPMTGEYNNAKELEQLEQLRLRYK